MAVVLALGVGWVAVALMPELLAPYPRFAEDGHLRASLKLAVNASFCRRSGYLSRTFDVTSTLLERPPSLFVPLRELVTRTFGSLDVYCQSVTSPFVNNENSHQWLLRGYFWLRPNASVADLGRALAILRLTAVFAMAYVLLRAGASVLLVAVITVAAGELLRQLTPYQYGMYPFIFVVPLVLISLAISRLRQSRPLRAVDLLFAGFIMAFCVNLRTSHTPIYLALFLSFVAASLLRTAIPSRGPRFAVVAGAAFVAGYAAFHVTFISSLVHPGAMESANHPVAHPLVLGLAVPETELSRREGIQWNDSVGLMLARRVDPSAGYLTPNYEKALFRYYGRLWRDHPAEMRATYSAKLRVAGVAAIRMAGRRLDEIGLRSGFMMWLADRTSGGVLLLFAVVTAGLGFFYYVRHGSLLAFAWSQISLVAALLIVESAVIMPEFYVFYDGVLLFYAFLLQPALVQIVVDLSWPLIAEIRAGTRPAAI